MRRGSFGLGSSATDSFESRRPILTGSCDAIPRMKQASEDFADNRARQANAADAQPDGLKPVTMILPVIFDAQANDALCEALIINIEQAIQASPLFFECQIDGTILKKNIEVTQDDAVHALSKRRIGFAACPGICEHLVYETEIRFLQEVIAGSVIGMQVCWVVKYLTATH